MSLRLYAATTSPGKLRDFQVAARAFSVSIEPLPLLGETPAPSGTGASPVRSGRHFDNGGTMLICAVRFPSKILVTETCVPKPTPASPGLPVPRD